MLQLGLELKKLLAAVLHLAGWLLLVLAVLNLGLGGVIQLNARPAETGPSSGPSEKTLLHLQLFGLVHLHENLPDGRPFTTAPGVIQYDYAQDPASIPVPSGTLKDLRSIKYTPELFPGQGQDSPGAYQRLLTDYRLASLDLLAANLTLLDRLRPLKPFLLPAPYLKAPEKPPAL